MNKEYKTWLDWYTYLYENNKSIAEESDKMLKFDEEKGWIINE
jgi:hypothetical protein